MNQARDSSLFLISKKDGEILDYVELPNKEINLSVVERVNDYTVIPITCSKYLVKCSEGFFVCNANTDTVYLYGNDKSLTPIIYKIPVVSNFDPVSVLIGFVDAGRYQFIGIETFSRNTTHESSRNLNNILLKNE